jgi:DNA-directed RNA polymerase specialized sigma24 family protein
VGDDDIVQEVFRDLFVDASRRQFPCDRDDRLLAILKHRASRRILDEIRKHLAARRDVRRETPWSNSPETDEHGSAEPVDPHVDQEQHVSIHEQFVRFVNSLELCEQVIVHLRLEHGTLEKVVDVLQGHWSLRKVQRIWEGICRKAREGKHMDG